MARPKTNYIVDFLIFISFIVTSITALIIFFFLPGGVRQSGYQTFLGVLKNTWSDVHTWAGLLMIALCVLHIILHWRWVVTMTKQVFSRSEKKGKNA